MKLKIWDEDVAKDASEDQLFVLLKLDTRDDNGDIDIRVVDKNKKEIKMGCVLTISNDLGILITHHHINSTIPLKTDVTDCPLVYSVNELRKIKAARASSTDEIISILFGKISEEHECKKTAH